MKFKNDKERIEFLKQRREDEGWYTWKEDSDIGRIWRRFDLPDCALVVEERQRTFEWPKCHIGLVVSWYIIKDWHLPFEDGTASRSLALAELKRVQKEHGTV